jgi:hypothetical protein
VCTLMNDISLIFVLGFLRTKHFLDLRFLCIVLDVISFVKK